jgi:hypothetical protein
MKRGLAVFADYLSNAAKSAALGALVAAAVAFIQGESVVNLGVAGTYALLGVACGTCSKALIEGALALLGAGRRLAYALNALIIAGIVIAFIFLFRDGFRGMRIETIILVIAMPEVGSALLVRSGLEEADRLKQALDKRRDELDEAEPR